MRLPLALLMALLLSGCANYWTVGQRYAPSDNIWKLGYSDTQLGPDTWRVTYAGNQIPQAQAQDYAMLRAAELVQAAGYSHFLVLSESGSAQTGPGMALATGSSAALMVPTSRPEATITVRGIRAADTHALDAAFVARSFRAKYRI